MKALFDRLVAFFSALASALRIAGTSVTLEESLETGEHAHAHVYIHMTQDFRRKGALSEFEFEGIKPHVEPNKASGKAYSGAVRHGHFYVIVNKKGSLFNWATFEPFKHYQVEAWWLDNLLKHEKIDREVYLSYVARIGVGFKRRLEDVRAAERYEKEKAVEEHVRTEALNLSKKVKRVKSYPEVDLFLAKFKPETLEFRRPILALIGGTNLGKSMLGADVLKRVSSMLQLPVHKCEPNYLEVTVEDNWELDFSDFDLRKHGGILLDGVGDAMILKQNREALQGRPKTAKGAQSKTMCHSYKYTLARRAVVASFDLSASNLHAFQSDHWLKNPLNVIQLHLSEFVVDDGSGSAGGVVAAVAQAAP